LGVEIDSGLEGKTKYRDAISWLRRSENLILGFLVVATVIAGIANYGFNIIAARFLSKDDYAALAALLSVFLVLTVPTSALQAIIAKQITAFRAADNPGAIKELMVRASKFLLIAGIIILVVMLASSTLIAHFLKIDSAVPVITLGFAVAFAAAYPVFIGYLQGNEKFGFLGFNMILQSVLRVVLGIILIELGLRVAGAIGASVIAYLLAIGLVYLQSRPAYAVEMTRNNVHIREILVDFIPAVSTLAVFWAFTSLDVVVVKRLFEESIAADYACASFLGKVILFLPAAVAIIMFPKTSYLKAKGGRTLIEFKKNLMMTVGLSGFVAILYILFPGFIISVFYGQKYLPAASVLRYFGVAMVFYAVINILLYYFVSIRKTAVFFAAMITALCLEIMAMSFFAKTLQQIVLVHFLVGFVVIVPSILVLRAQGKLERSIAYE
jgi:O-antigen/teichoic acid export membrane protein